MGRSIGLADIYPYIPWQRGVIFGFPIFSWNQNCQESRVKVWWRRINGRVELNEKNTSIKKEGMEKIRGSVLTGLSNWSSKGIVFLLVGFHIL